MVGTIGFAGSRARAAGRFRDWWFDIGSIFLLASLAGGVILGSVLAFGAALSQHNVPTSPRMVGGGILILLAIGADAGKVSPRLIARSRQVPLSWKHVLPPSLSAGLYGLTLGTGLATTVYSWSFWTLVVASILIGAPVMALIAGALYGLGRALPALLAALAPREDSADRVLDWVARHSGVVRIGSVVLGSLLLAVLALEWHGEGIHVI